MENKTILTIESLDHEARGVARHEGKVVFVQDALPGETVQVRFTRQKPQFDLAVTEAVLKPGASRTTPRCPHFGVCGGCNMQHADPVSQIAFKQRILEDCLERIGKVQAEVLLPVIQGPAWGYRHRARLSVRHVAKKGGVLVGFHERSSSFVAEMGECHTLPPKMGFLIRPLRELMMELSIRDRLPQIEMAVGDAVTVLVLRILETPSDDDCDKLKAFADQHGVQFWFQTKGPDTATPFYPLEAPALHYRLEEFGITMPFGPTEFTQVNPGINQMLVGRAVRLLNPQPHERVGDFFCGLGNFTLPLARSGATVVGVEGSEALVKRAAQNARANGLEQNTEFQVANLFEATEESLKALGPMDKVLIDPPRDGAVELVKSIHALMPKRIVYVSCNPSTLARDAEILVHHQGYRLVSAGVANMFPHTAHVESIALFESP